MTDIQTVIIVILLFAVAYLVLALRGSIRNQARQDMELNDIHAHNTALQRRIDVLTPKRGPLGRFQTKPKHNSGTDPVVIEMRK